MRWNVNKTLLVRCGLITMVRKSETTERDDDYFSAYRDPISLSSRR